MKALANQIVENHWRSEEAWRPSSSKAVMPRSIGGVLSSALIAHQIVSEVAQSQEKMPKDLGSGPTISLGSDSDLDNWEDCDMCFRRNQKCTWDLRGKAKSCIPCWDNKQWCEPAGASRKLPSLKRVPEEAEELEEALKWKRAHVAGSNSEMAELNRMLRSISEGIQGVIRGIDDRRKNDVKILGVLLDIWSVMWDYVWKAELDAWSNTRSVDGDQELVGLEREQEEVEKKASEMDVENALLEEFFPPEDLNETLREE